MEDTLVSLFGPVLARLWVGAVTLVTAAYLMEFCFRDFGKSTPKKRKRFKPARMRAQLTYDPTWPPRPGSPN